MAAHHFRFYVYVKDNRCNYKTVNSNLFIERLKRLRALDPSSSRFDKDGQKLKVEPFSDIRTFQRPT